MEIFFVIAILLAALAFLGARVRRTMGKASAMSRGTAGSCDGCSCDGCPAVKDGEC